MKITIFGSCRQDSMYKNFNVTSIRDKLTYPHYSAEALQAMRFCKAQISDEIIDLKFAFRSLIISNRFINKEKILDDFKKTGLFAIEIATRKAYKYKNIYLHHICEDPSYGCAFMSEVIIADLTDTEIENDIVAMQSLVYPKKIFIITHFYTRAIGKRYELVKSLKKIGLKNNIPVFDPVAEVGGVDKILPLLMFENPINHYNKAGHSIIGEHYKKFIFNNFKIKTTMRNKIINIIYSLFMGARQALIKRIRWILS